MRTPDGDAGPFLIVWGRRQGKGLEQMNNVNTEHLCCALLTGCSKAGHLWSATKVSQVSLRLKLVEETEVPSCFNPKTNRTEHMWDSPTSWQMPVWLEFD